MKDLPVILLFVLVFAFLTRVDFIFYIVYVCVGIYLWSLWYTPRSVRRLRLSRNFANHAFLGESVPVTLRLENGGRLPVPWLLLDESIPLALRSERPLRRVVSLGSRQSRDFTYRVQAMRRGYYRLGPLRITTGDQFGFADNSGRLPADFLTVFPRITPLSRLGLPSRLPFGTVASQQRLFEDPARPIGVRGYRSGDSRRQINWKVSAHMEHLVVKTYEPAISLEAALLLNLRLADYDDRYSGPEWAIEVAASLAAHLVEQRQPVGLIVNGADPRQQMGELDFDEESGRLLLKAGRSPEGPERPSPLPPRPGRQHLMKILELLARVEAADMAASTEWMRRACLHLSWGVTTVAITPAGDEGTCQGLHRLVRAGYNPLLLVVQPMANFGQVQERARRLGFRAFYVPERRDLKRWQRRRERP